MRQTYKMPGKSNQIALKFTKVAFAWSIISDDYVRYLYAINVDIQLLFCLFLSLSLCYAFFASCAMCRQNRASTTIELRMPFDDDDDDYSIKRSFNNVSFIDGIAYTFTVCSIEPINNGNIIHILTVWSSSPALGHLFRFFILQMYQNGKKYCRVSIDSIEFIGRHDTQRRGRRKRE